MHFQSILVEDDKEHDDDELLQGPMTTDKAANSKNQTDFDLSTLFERKYIAKDLYRNRPKIISQFQSTKTTVLFHFLQLSCVKRAAKVSNMPKV